MSNRITVYIFAASLLWLTSCHKQRSGKSMVAGKDSSTVMKEAAKRDSLTVKAVAVSEPVKVQQIAFDYLLAKSKFSFQSPSQNFDNTNVNIRIKKDSLIWISVTGVGFEVARGLITPDSIVFMDKFHKEYFVLSYAELSRQYNFDLNFPLLQSIIVGNLPFPAAPDAKFLKTDAFFLLKQNEGRILIDNYIGDTNLKLTRFNATEVPTQNKFYLDYEDFKEVGGFLFPFSSRIKLDIQSKKDKQFYQTTLGIKHTKVDLVAQNPGFPFSIPSGYTRKGKK